MTPSRLTGSIPPLPAAVGIMMIVQIIMSMSVLSAPVLVALAAPELGIEIHAVGYYFSAIYGFATFSAMLCGSFIGRFGSIRLTQICLLVGAVSLCLAATGNSWAVVVAGPLFGLAMGPTTPASSELLVRLSPPKHRNLIFSFKQTGVPIGNALAGAVLPGLALMLGWKPPLVILAAICALLALVIETQRRVLDAGAGRAGALFSWRGVLGPMGMILRSPPLLRVSLSSGLYGGMQACVGAFLVVLLTQRAGFDLVTAGMVLTAAQVSGAAGRVTWGFVADRSGRPSLTLCVIGTVMTLFAVVIGAVENDWPLALILIASSVLGATAIGWNGVYLAEVARLAPAGKVGAITGATSMYTFGGVLIVPSLFSMVVAQTGSYQLGFLVAALLSAGGALLCLPGILRRSTPA